MALIAKAFELAKKQLLLDWKEKDGQGSNPKITQVYACVDGLGNPEMIDDSSVAWCSAFVNWCIQMSGGKGTRNAAARSWLDWGKSSEGKVGDIVVLRRGTSSWQGHVGFVVSKGLLYVEILGGNQDNDVCVKKYLRANVLGYRTSLDA